MQTVDAHINSVVKGGLTATVNGLRGFIPASQMELHFVKDLSGYVGQTVQALPIEIESHKRRLVLSRRLLFENRRRKLDPVAAKKLQEATIEIPARITEAQRLVDTQEIVRFLKTSRTMIINLETQLQLYLRLNYFSATQTDSVLTLCKEICELLNSKLEEFKFSDRPKSALQISKQKQEG